MCEHQPGKSEPPFDSTVTAYRQSPSLQYQGMATLDAGSHTVSGTEDGVALINDHSDAVATPDLLDTLGEPATTLLSARLFVKAEAEKHGTSWFQSLMSSSSTEESRLTSQPCSRWNHVPTQCRSSHRCDR